MDARLHHARGAQADGVVMATPARPLLALAFGALVAGMLGGLLRAGALPPQAAPALLGAAAAWHAALMICAFFGTVIGIERAVALKHPAAFTPPLASAAGGVALLLGAVPVAHAAFVAAGAGFVLANAAIVRRQPAPHTALLLLAAVAWLGGSLLYMAQPGQPAVLALWFAFLVLTIAAERLEMTRLMRHRRGAQPLLYALTGALLGSAALSLPWPRAGGLLYGVALAGLALWLAAFDIARRTVRTPGLTRYMALCLLGGYAWLAAGGVAWALTALGQPTARDAALHAIGLGFVFSMVMGHAPVILPAVARIKIAFGWAFYLPLAALHGSLLLRLAGAWLAPGLLAVGAALNAASLVLFLFTMAGGAVAWRVRHGGAPRRAALRTRTP